MNTPALLLRGGRAAYITAALLLFTLLPGITLSARAQATDTGTIAGTVVDTATGSFLRGALVQVDGSTLSEVTEANGSFRLTGVPAGSRNLTISYAGLETAKQSVAVTAGQVTRLEVGLTSQIYQLQKFVVAGEREGQAAAVNQQRTANNLKNVVASDGFGDLVDNNAAELLKRLSGVAMDYNGEDASGIRLRGIDPVNTSVTVDGNSLVNASSAGYGDRAANFRQVTVENIETIEVNKAPSAAQPGNSLGGQINFITKSAFSQKGRRMQLTTGLNLNTAAMTLGRTPQGANGESRAMFPSIAATYSDVFGSSAKQLGVSVTTTFDGRYRYNTNYAPSYSYVPAIASGAAVVPESPTIASSLSLSEASAASRLFTLALNLDYRLSPDTTVYSRNAFRKGRNLWSYNHSISFSPGTQTSGSGAGQVAINGNTTDQMVATSGTITKTAGASGAGSFNQTAQFTLGAKQAFGDLSLDYSAFTGHSFDNSVEDRPTYMSYSQKAVGFTIANVNSRAEPNFRQTSGADYTDLSNYSGLSGTSGGRYGADTQWGGRIDAKRTIAGAKISTTIDAGLLYNRQNRRTSNAGRKWNFNLPVPLNTFADEQLNGNWAARGFPVVIGPSLDLYKVLAYAADHPGVMVEDITGYSLVRDLNGRKRFQEEIAAGYAMATVKVGQLTVVPGLRYENTADEMKGPVYYANLGAGITDPVEKIKAQYVPETRRNNYGTFFPNFQAKYDVTRRFVLRGAYTQTIGRPAFGDLVPGDTVNTANQSITRNNTELKPFFAKNYDLGAEYYFSDVGVISAGVFRKQIADYVQSTTFSLPGGSDNGYNGDYAGYLVSSKTNVGTARMQGVEFSYTQALTFLPGLARHLSANATYTAIQRTPPPGIPDLTRIVPAIYNAGLTYNDGRLLVGISYNLRKKYLSSYNANTRQSTYVRDNGRVDLTVNYKLTRNCTAFFDWRNMLNEKDWTTVFDRTVTYFEGGTTVNVGLRTNF